MIKSNKKNRGLSCVRAAGVILGVFTIVPTASALPNLWINELHYDNDGGDIGEMIEVAGEANFDLSTVNIYLYNGNNGASYSNSGPLAGLIPDQANGFGSLGVSISGIQNGAPDGVALVYNDGSANHVLQFLSYEGNFTATDGPASGLTSQDIGVSEPSGTPVGHSVQLTGTGLAYSDFTWTGPAAASPGSINANQFFPAPDIVTPPVVESVPDSISTLGMLSLVIAGVVFGERRRRILAPESISHDASIGREVSER